MEYSEKLCLNCGAIHKTTGKNGHVYCCRGEDGELRGIEEQTGSSTGAVNILIHFFNITEEDLNNSRT